MGKSKAAAVIGRIFERGMKRILFTLEIDGFEVQRIHLKLGRITERL